MSANTPLAKARTRRVLAKAPRPLKLEIGGLVQRPGWVVTNVNAVTRNYLDATVRWPLEDASVSHVYSDNVIEHLPLEATRAMLREAHRCLQPGGVIRLITPDVRAHVEMYLSGAPALDSAAAQHYRALGLHVEHPIDVLRVPIGEFGHHAGYMYDLETLTVELERAGFHSVVRTPTGSSEHPDFDGLDQRTSEGGAQLSVEATR
ncbi:methyltransferase domain protein [Aeromicrobium marinum DSM 15272]|uniref:Methyltransferase domain protein n=2 Tax=Aeromicrobium marinum TaxID=219314 RepID=E2SFF6_9ACTN|nr:methyltransferase domain protein [Aeromicrobium marinum DSM 15272]